MRLKGKKKTLSKVGNQGYSLIELIVIVLILGVVSGSFIVGIQMARSHDAMRCAKNIASSLERARAETISKVDGSVSLELIAKSDGYYATFVYTNGGIRKIGDEIKVGTRAVTIKLHTGALEEELGVISPITFTFSKSTGAFLVAYDKIEVIGSDIVDVELVEETGRSFVSAR